ncbi:hypothetical protein CMV_016290 [Castanea mollissima]|uniref:Uncharacterized protein n=1 Tax=Castanea mollissima TaxID=60419 RepID=A0A8J4VRX8_9ROSI|nr:hypothetical protein CMV_016290 [Castanea mollissima]
MARYFSPPLSVLAPFLFLSLGSALLLPQLEAILNGPENKVNIWKATLKDVTNLAGLHLKPYRPEPEFIEEIVKTIWKILYAPVVLDTDASHVEEALDGVAEDPKLEGHVRGLIEPEIPKHVEDHHGLQVGPVALALLELLRHGLPNHHRRLAHHAAAVGLAEALALHESTLMIGFSIGFVKDLWFGI